MTDNPTLVYLALEDWFSSTRLPRGLTTAGCKVVVVCTPASPLIHANGIERSVAVGPESVGAALEAVCDHHRAALIVPADEAAVAALQRLARGEGEVVAPDLVALIERSIGVPARDGSTSKQRVNEIAGALGIAVPRQAVVDTVAGACAFAQTVGYPIMLKKEATFGGMGVMGSASDRETLIAWYRLNAQTRWQRGVARVGGGPAYALAPLRRALMERTGAPLIAQQFIAGRLGFRSFVADRGRVLAGLTALAEEHNPAPFGASSVVRFIEHPEIARATETLVRALDLSGFGGIDFIVEADGRAHLLELNARVTPIAHLGKSLGIDLCAALHAALAGVTPVPPPPMTETVVALFPSEIERDPNSRWLTAAMHDVPWEDRELLDAWRGKLAEPVRAFLARHEPAA